jgi:ABC-type sugar transport system ATPase subunit
MALGEVMLAESSLSARSPTPVPRLSVREMSKTFPGLKALDRVSLEVHAGEIVAVVGHNGSGKSTLVKLLAGVYTPDPGAEIVFHPADGSSLRESEVRSRLHFIHQDLGLIDTLSTVENLSLGKIDGWRRFGPAHARAERRHARALVGGFGASFDVSRPVGLLSPAERAIVAIARALDGCDGPDHVLVLDECPPRSGGSPPPGLGLSSSLTVSTRSSAWRTGLSFCVMVLSSPAIVPPH